MSFLFSCFKSDAKGQCYQVRQKSINKPQSIKYVSTWNQLTDRDIQSASQIMKVNKSQYKQLVNKYKTKKQLWKDQTFATNISSLGNLPQQMYGSYFKWKRLGQLKKTQKNLFGEFISPKSIPYPTNLPSSFHSFIQSFSNYPQLIYNIFDQQVNLQPNGIYKVRIKINGKVQEVLVDDYLPLDSQGNMAGWRSTSKLTYTWVFILLKAWAKVNVTYANALNTTVQDLYRAFGCCPAQRIILNDQRQPTKDKQKKLVQYIKRGYLISCITKNQQKKWKQCGLLQNRSYRIISAQYLNDKFKQYHLIIKLQCLINNGQWKGEFSTKDTNFWMNIEKNSNYSKFVQKNNSLQQGIFFMNFYDFCQYFQEINICMIQKSPMYQVVQRDQNEKSEQIFTFEVKKQGYYTIQLHQSRQKSNIDDRYQKPCRSTLILTDQNYKLIQSSLSYLCYTSQLPQSYCLQPGIYYIYTKLQANPSHPLQSSLSIYSQNLVKLDIFSKLTNNIKQATFLQKVCEYHAKNNISKTFYNNMKISYKLFFQKGGFAYIYFSNNLQSQKSFVLQFEQKQFNDRYFQLDKSFKNQAKQKLIIKPGQSQLIVCHVMINAPKELRFPPPIKIKIEQIK